jgi:hypothetical protein
MMFRGGRVLVLLCFVAASRAATAQPPALPDVLQRAGAYVVSFQHQLAGIVAEERYVQDAFVPPQKSRASPRMAAFASSRSTPTKHS